MSRNIEFISYLRKNLSSDFFVEPFEPKHLTELKIRQEQYDALEFLSMNNRSLEEYATYLYNISPYNASVTYKGKVVLCGGVTPLWPRVGEGWMFLHEDIKKVFEAVPMSFIKFFKRFFKNLPFHRIQTIVDPGFKQAVKFIELCGFKREGIMEKYHPNGTDYYRYALIKEIN